MNPKAHAFLRTDPRNWMAVPLRLALGIIMPAHGAQKLFGWFGGGGPRGTGVFFEQIGLQPGVFWATLAGLGEFFGGLLLLIGLATRLGAITIGTVMLVAILLVHRNAFFVSDQGMELPLTIFAASIALLIGGGGAASVDSRLASSRAIPVVTRESP
jgi:putative oxidoreductase